MIAAQASRKRTIGSIPARMVKGAALALTGAVAMSQWSPENRSPKFLYAFLCVGQIEATAKLLSRK